jgi:hypothetical protein
MSLTVICPTRGRQVAAYATWKSFVATREREDTNLLFAISDDEDPGSYDVPLVIVPRREWMNEVLQSAVDRILAETPPTLLGFIGDDNRFRTRGWDTSISDALSRGGFAHCNDLHRHDIPTHVFATTEIVKVLGYFGLRGCRHLYLDSAWMVLGNGAGCITYLPDVIIEHLHPFIGKGEMDDSYRASNSPAMYDHDLGVFQHWLQTDAEKDIEIVKATLA